MRYGFVVPGRPVPAVRMTQRSKWTDAAQRSLAYQRTVGYAAIAQSLPRPLPWEWMGISIRIYLKATKERKGRMRLPKNAGDWDNCAKAIQDGLQHAGVIGNDRAVIAGMVRMIPCESEADERAEVELWEEDGTKC